MIQDFHHFSLIVSSEESVRFYETLGFTETKRIKRQSDTVVLMESSNGIKAELFIDPTHPARNDNPENIGVRYLSFKVEDIESFCKKFSCRQINTDWNGERYCMMSDPDGIPIQFHE